MWKWEGGREREGKIVSFADCSGGEKGEREGEGEEGEEGSGGELITVYESMTF